MKTDQSRSLASDVPGNHFAGKMQVVIPDALKEQLKSQMSGAGIPVPDTEERWQQAFKALKVSLPDLSLNIQHGCFDLDA